MAKATRRDPDMSERCTEAAVVLDVASAHPTEPGLDLAIVHELLSLVRPSFRRFARSEALGPELDTCLPAPFDRLDHHRLEIAMRDGQLVPADFDAACLPLLQRHAASILCVALGQLLRRAERNGVRAWLSLFAVAAELDDGDRQMYFATFSPAQRFVVAMSLRLAARHCAANDDQHVRLRRAARRWWPRA
jgi:hypothetical protein